MAEQDEDGRGGCHDYYYCYCLCRGRHHHASTSSGWEEEAEEASEILRAPCWQTPPPPPPPQPGHRKGLILGGGLSICFEKASEVTCGRGRRTVDYGLWVVGCGLAGWRAWGGCSWAGGRLLLPFTLFPIRSTLLFSHSLSLSPPRLRSPDFSSSLLLSSPHPT